MHLFYYPSIHGPVVTDDIVEFYFEFAEIKRPLQIANISVTQRTAGFSANCTVSDYGINSTTIFTNNTDANFTLDFDCTTTGIIVVDVSFGTNQIIFNLRLPFQSSFPICKEFFLSRKSTGAQGQDFLLERAIPTLMSFTIHFLCLCGHRMALRKNFTQENLRLLFS